MDRIRYYQNELTDDFSPSRGKIHAKKIDASFPYRRTNPLWNTVGWIVYHLLAIPLIFLYSKIVYGLRVKNLRELRKLHSGYFLYANHTNMLLDAFFPSLIAFPRRCSIITSADAVSIPGLMNLVQMLGVVPLPQTASGGKKFLAEIHRRALAGHAIMIYPEAHIWQYFSGVRPFADGSFAYPVKENLPAVGAAVVYRQRRIFRNLPPMATVVIGKPVFPDRTLSDRAARKKIRGEIYDFLCGTVKSENSYEYIQYKKAE